MTSHDVIPAATAAQSDPSPKGCAGGSNRALLAQLGQFLFIVLCAIFAFYFTWICGRRGFFALDQSIVFDGGYRVAGGQVIYRDFVAPSGPLVYWIQGLVFKLFGVSYRVYILTAAGCNLLAAVGVFVLLKRLLRDCWLWAAAGMLLTAAWFYPISGTPFMENTGFLVVLVALLFAVPRDGRCGIYRTLNWRQQILPSILAGTCLFASFLCKQNVGLFATPVVLIALLFARIRSWKSFLVIVIAFASGFAIAAGLFFAWLRVFSSIPNFVKFFITVPREDGGTRLRWVISFWLRHGPAAALAGGFSDHTQFVLGICALVCLMVLLLAVLKRKNPSWRAYRIASFISLALMFLQSAFALSTNNDSVNALPFLGIIVAVAGANACRLLEVTRPRISPWIRGGLLIVFSVVTLLITLSGARHAYDRTMQDTCVNMPFQAVAPAPVIGEFLWPVPMFTGRREIIRREDCGQVIGIIRSQPDNVFVLGDWKVLYAAAGRASTDPLLWYHRGITYPSAYDPAIDAWMVENLKQKNVGVVIVENSTWLTSGEDNLDYFRQFHTFLQSHYRPTRYGVFEVYTRQNP